MKNFISRYLKNPKLYFQDRRRGVIISRSANARGCRFEGKNKVYEHTDLWGSSIGLGTYVSSHSRLRQCIIGRYCSIGSHVAVLSGNHPVSERISTHPCFFSMKRQAGFTYVAEQNFDEFLFCDPVKKIAVEIGSDVWIGSHVIIVGGVKIGHGAVIATGSVVTKNVEPYSIVGGVPAKFIKYRFNEKTREELLRDEWWEKDEKWIGVNLSKFTDDLCDKFID